MPLVAPITLAILPDFIASCITPQALELITAVGPPDCATIALGFEFIVTTPLLLSKVLIKSPVSGRIYTRLIAISIVFSFGLRESRFDAFLGVKYGKLYDCAV
jgi:hypothetical protein